MTFLQMQTRVGNLINRDVTDDTGTITETEVKAFLNIGYRRAINAVVATNEEFYVRQSKADLAENQVSYALPTDCRKLKQLQLAYLATTDYSYAKRFDLNMMEDPEDTVSTANPIYHLVDKHYEINPTPTTAVEDGIILYYIEKQDDMSDGADEPHLPIGYEDIPVLYAVSKAKQKLGLEAEAQAYLTEFYTEIDKMTAQVTPRALDGNDYVKVVDYMN